LLNENSGNRAPTFMELGLYNIAPGSTFWVSLQLKYFSLKKNLLKELLNTDILFGRSLTEDRSAAPFFRGKIIFSQFTFNTHDIGFRLIYFINRYYNGDLGSFSMIDGLFGLIHNSVISSDYQDYDIGNLGTTRTHLCKCSMTGSIKKNHITFW